MYHIVVTIVVVLSTGSPRIGFNNTRNTRVRIPYRICHWGILVSMTDRLLRNPYEKSFYDVFDVLPAL